MGSANGDKSSSARKKRRRAQELTPGGAGEMLRSAREQVGIDLAEVHDRTGISWRNLEALESGDVQRFSNPSAAAVAMRRYAELVDLDPVPLVASLTRSDYALAGAPAKGGSSTGSRSRSRHAVGTHDGTSWAPTAEPNESGHLRNHFYDDSHLRSFTQTAQVPAVRGGYNGAGPIPTQYRGRFKRKAPLPLRILTWLLLLLIVVGAGGIAVDHYEPQWLRKAHILKSTSPKTHGSSSSKTGKSKSTGSKSSSSTTIPPAGLVRTTSTGIGEASVNVAASNYTIVVTASNACWVDAHDQTSVNPLVNRTLEAGQTVSIPVTGGQMTVELGAAAGTLFVEVGGQRVSGWSLKPNAVPFVTTFTGS